MTRLAPAMTILVIATSGEARAGEAGTLELVEAIELAIQAHPAVKSVEAQVVAAKTVPGQVSAWEDPVFSLMTGIPFQSPQDPPEISMTVTQVIPLSPVYAYKKAAASAQADAIATMIPGVELDVAEAVARAYYEVVFLEELRGVVERELELAASIVEAASLRFASLAGSQADVVRARISRDEIETELEVLELDIGAARRLLVLLLGDGRDPRGFAVAAPSYPAVTLDEKELTEMALAHRPELEYFDMKAVELEKKEKASKAGYAPFLTVSAGYMYKSDTLDGLMGQDALALGFAVNLPLQVKKRKLAVDEAQAHSVANDASKQAAILKIAERIVELRTAVATLEEKIALQDGKVVPEAGIALELTLSSYVAQSADITDVLSAFEKLLAAEEKRSRLRGAYYATFARLQREVGTFTDPL